MLLDTRSNNISCLEVGISKVFEILGHLLFKGDRTTKYSHDLTYHQMLLHTRNNKISGLRVEISTVFEIFGHFLYQGVQDNSVWS
jgi:CRISPR/Cas system CMR-associated protein Cmr3 (group 5 of RAMP superfamily)